MLLLIFVFSWRCSESNPSSGAEPETASALSKADFFVAYDSPPTPIGGFKAIQQRLRYPDIARLAGIEGRVILYRKRKGRRQKRHARLAREDNRARNPTSAQIPTDPQGAGKIETVLVFTLAIAENKH